MSDEQAARVANGFSERTSWLASMTEWLDSQCVPYAITPTGLQVWPDDRR